MVLTALVAPQSLDLLAELDITSTLKFERVGMQVEIRMAH